MAKTAYSENMGTEIDWFVQYLKKFGLIITPEQFPSNRAQERPFTDFLEDLLPPPRNIVECGCGLARTALSLAYYGYRVTAVDLDPRMLEIAYLSASELQLPLRCVLADFRKLTNVFPDSEFDCVSHGSVLEHFTIGEIREIIAEQLHIAPLVVFSVPLDSKGNRDYFLDNIYRNLWNAAYWLQEVLCDFDIVASKEAEGRTNNLLVAIQR